MMEGKTHHAERARIARRDGGHGYGHEHPRSDHGVGHGYHPRDCPCCGGTYHHARYFREHELEYKRTESYQAYREYVKTCKPTPRPPCDQPETEPDCPARTASGLWIRKATTAMTAADWQRFQDAWLAMCASGFIGDLVFDHRGPHRMHGYVTPRLERFLPWHRVFLLRLEEEIHRVEPCAILPYWDWDPVQGFPAGLVGFLPPVPLPDGTTHTPSRGSWTSGVNATPPGIPVPGTEGFVVAAADYGEHSRRNEGSHDTVHGSVGGSMMSLANAPTDPVFYMHHANADRMWAVWQQANPGAGTVLTGAEAVMDPWTETEGDVQDITALGYTYV